VIVRAGRPGGARRDHRTFRFGPHRYALCMEEHATTTEVRPGGAPPDPQAPTAFDRRQVCRNTHPRLNPEIDRVGYDRSIELFARVVGN
jgi:hypothetical protein